MHNDLFISDLNLMIVNFLYPGMGYRGVGTKVPLAEKSRAMEAGVGQNSRAMEAGVGQNSRAVEAGVGQN